MTRTREDVRAVWTRVWRWDLVQDVRHAMRGARRSPGFTATALLMIALGVGGTAAVFSVVYAVLLRPLPYPDPDRIVSVVDVHPGSTSPASGTVVSNLTYTVWQPGARTIEALGALGEPHFRELEPSKRLAAPTGRTSSRRLIPKDASLIERARH